MPDITLSIEDAAAIRKALVAALEDSGGGVEDEDDPALSPGLSEHTRDREMMLPEAIRLLDEAVTTR
jgi:hypothetical protein